MYEPPLLAVEIISPPQSHQDVVDKIRGMLAAGVASCWFAQPAIRGITAFREGAAPRTVTEGTLDDPGTGLAVDVPALFGQA